jgi:hypothetical protein
LFPVTEEEEEEEVAGCVVEEADGAGLVVLGILGIKAPGIIVAAPMGTIVGFLLLPSLPTIPPAAVEPTLVVAVGTNIEGIDCCKFCNRILAIYGFCAEKRPCGNSRISS